MATISNLSVSLTANTKGLSSGFNKAKKEVKGFTKSVSGLKAGLAGALGIAGGGAIFASIIRTNTEMQKLKSSLKTMTGSAKEAGKAFKQIENFAVTTPFDLEQWTSAFIKMKSLGLDPSKEALTAYGNTASAMGKDLNQMIEAVADAATGEFERLKEFGIKAKKQGDQVSFTFQGVTTQIGNNAQEIEKYLQDIGNNTFGSAMADQMNDLGPAFSNMNQAFSTLAVKIGESGLNDMVVNLTNSITAFTNSFTDTRAHTISQFFEGIGNAISKVAEVWNAITFLQGDGMLKQFEKNNVSQIGNKSIPGYQLGDFNRSFISGGGSSANLENIKKMEAKYSEEAQRQRKEANEILKSISNNIKTPAVAVAG